MMPTSKKALAVEDLKQKKSLLRRMAELRLTSTGTTYIGLWLEGIRWAS